MPAPARTNASSQFRTLPPLAGVCSIDAAENANWSVDESVARLKRIHYALKRLHEVFNARITAEPVYELKTAFSYHAYLCAEHVAALRKRVGEMREPPLGLEVVPDEGLRLFYDEILAAPTTAELLVGLYEKAVGAVIDACRRFQQDANPLADAPSNRVLRFALVELGDMRQFGEQAIASLVDAAGREAMQAWLAMLDVCLVAAGGMDGMDHMDDMDGVPAAPAPLHSARPFQFDAVPKRDERFRDSYNAGVNPEVFLYDERFRPRDKTLMIYYKRLRELDVPEMMASIIHETRGKDWGYYLEMSRQLWDEARHAMMGEVGFAANGIDWTKIPINFTWSLNLNTQLTALERHGVLYFIEQGLMPRTGKRYEWEVGRASGDELSRLFQDFDWADEVLHSQIGRRWYVPLFGSLKESLDYGDRCWSKVLSHWRDYKERGLTEHRNWWPDVYRQACANWNVEPDPAALAYHETYEETRADLKDISASA
jgi:hypothetical protein